MIDHFVLGAAELDQEIDCEERNDAAVGTASGHTRG